MAFSKKVQEDALVACGRKCCICHRFCGSKMELHHIIKRADSEDDSFENCIPLCFDCHADMGKRDAHHPKGKGYSPEELRRHRDNWYQREQATFTAKVAESDKQLFNEICTIFQPLMYELMETDLSYGVENITFKQLRKWIYDEGNPFKEFLDGDFESARVCLVNAADEFNKYFIVNTFPLGDRIVPHIYLMEIGEISDDEENKKQFEEEACKLNDLATKLWSEYQKFVRICRHRMK